MQDNQQEFDTVIIGAGAAGLMCAGEASKRGRRVLVLDHAAKVGEKIRISGGGRANFTNLHVAHRSSPYRSELNLCRKLPGRLCQCMGWLALN